MATQSDQAQIYCQLVPLAGMTLLLPRRALGQSLVLDAVRLETGGPPWLLGYADVPVTTTANSGWGRRRWWRRAAATEPPPAPAKYPVIALEALAGGSVPVRNRRSRVIPLRSPCSALEYGGFAVVSQGFARFTAVNAAALRALPPAPSDAGIALSRVGIGSMTVLIPDLGAIEQRIADALATVADGGLACEPWQPKAPGC